ncbi:hypothetical protein GCM10007940_43990 [Portibacter lacus]|uniref:Uncharacterized protein n=1 Tax=Portibacter lacus TaxID=1099794 RepID=A0AA37WGF3_9BACT|nr:hypothetical protein GCM10007940_43990 [Portibacter lacus]
MQSITSLTIRGQIDVDRAETADTIQGSKDDILQDKALPAEGSKEAMKSEERAIKNQRPLRTK